MAASRVLIIDDDESLRKVMGYMLEEAGDVVDRAASADEGLRIIADRRPDLVLSDIKMPKKDGIELLADIKRVDPTIPVVILTAFASVETAVEAMKRGASDYLTKPIARDDLTLTVAKTLKLHRLEVENENLRTTINDRFRFDSIIGLSPAMTAMFDALKKVAPTDATVLITGESGTGKELIAKAIHYHSPRREHRLVAVNCAAIPSELLESELFGHVRGAFTGAIRNKIGKFELAHGGTLFLDEIGAMPVHLQAKLLRALQEREIERVGDERTIEVDVRVIAATNRALPALVAAGEFRADLFYRLNVVPVNVPPLRERRGDIALLVAHFVQRFAGGAHIAVTREAMDALSRHRWPGNVRELENFCERAVLMRSRDVIDDIAVAGQLSVLANESPHGPSLRDVERATVVEALRASGWNRSRAARRLGVPRHILLYRIKKFGIVEEAS
jgi:DNA-binding NtrC family response regulator